MKGLMIAGLALILAAAVPFTVLGESKEKRTRDTDQVWKHDGKDRLHEQGLGGDWRHDYDGRSVDADDHAPVVQPVAPPPLTGTNPPSTGGTSAASGGTSTGTGGTGTTSGSGLTGATAGTVTSTGPATL